MPARRPRARVFIGFAFAAVLTLTVGSVGTDPGLSAVAAPAEQPISPVVDRIVTVDSTVRAEPSHDAAAVTVLSAGDKVAVSAQAPGWRKVTVAESEGWVPYSVTADVPRELATRSPRELAVDVPLRAQPGEKAAAVATVYAHTYASLAAVSGAWRKISTANGAGWVPASTLEEVSAERFAATKTLNVRASATGRSDVNLTLDKGQMVLVLGTRGEWSSVRAGSHGARAAVYSGWTATKYLFPNDIRVTKTALNLRSSPWTGKILTVIPQGAQVTLTRSKAYSTARTPHSWHQVMYGSRTGWVATTYLKRPY